MKGGAMGRFYYIGGKTTIYIHFKKGVLGNLQYDTGNTCTIIRNDEII